MNLKPVRVLFVEDHVDTLWALSRLFRRLGCETLTADSCAAARAVLAERGPVDVVVGDVGLPDGDGIALLEELKRLYGTPAVALTGRVMPDDARRYERSDVDWWLAKPTGIQDLRDVVEALAGACGPIGFTAAGTDEEPPAAGAIRRAG
jgi:CheY-like chemotaxis protein